MIDIKENGLMAKKLPTDGLCTNVQKIIKSVSDSYQCSPDMVLTGAFQVVGAAVGKKLIVNFKDYDNYLCLWIANVANSGSNKSAPIKALFRPLQTLDSENYKVYLSELQEWKAAETENKSIPRPKFLQKIIGDCTPEARNQVLADCNEGVILYRDEIKGLLDDIGRYNKSGEVSQLLSIFDADNIPINRKGDGPMLIEKPFMSIFGSIQPDVLQETFGSPTLMGNGFNQRWLFCYPDATPPPMYSDTTVPKNITEAWESFIISLASCDFNHVGGKLILNDDATQVYVKYFNQLQTKKADSDSYMGAVYSKLQIHVLRWAGITHLLGNNPQMSHIIGSEMDYSVRCMDYFENCAKKVYDTLCGNVNKRFTKFDVLKLIYQTFDLPDKCQSSLADILHCSQSLVNRADQEIRGKRK